jgi:hypothetical protein
MKTAISILLLICVCASRSVADLELCKLPRVISSKNGYNYARTFPDKTFDRTGGTTRIYRVGFDGDELLHTFNWYADSVYLEDTSKGVAVVRIGPWPRERDASHDDLVLGFYLDGKFLKQYSALDIAGSRTNVLRSISHYMVIKTFDGFEYQWGRSDADKAKIPELVFIVTTIDSRTLKFNVFTGELMQ